MPVVRYFTRRQWEALGCRLDAPPGKAKDEQPLKLGDGVKSIRRKSVQHGRRDKAPCRSLSIPLTTLV
jgi:hypothetical protein